MKKKISLLNLISLFLLTGALIEFGCNSQKNISASKNRVITLGEMYPFEVRFRKDSLSVRFYSQKFTLSSAEKLDKYLKGNIDNIDKHKVLMSATSSTPIDEVKEVHFILLKYNIVDYKKILLMD
jgi:hypothetical protein